MANDNFIKAVFADSSGGITGLSPTITIYKDSDSSAVVSAAAMTEIAVGIYKYNFSARVIPEGYTFQVDGGAGVTTTSRYIYGVIHSPAEDVQEWLDANSIWLPNLDKPVSAIRSGGGGGSESASPQEIAKKVVAALLASAGFKDAIASAGITLEEVGVLISKEMETVENSIVATKNELVAASTEIISKVSEIENFDATDILKGQKVLQKDIASTNKELSQKVAKVELTVLEESVKKDIPQLQQDEKKTKDMVSSVLKEIRLQEKRDKVMELINAHE